MLQGHVFNSFTRSDLRSGGPYVFSQFLGGMPPAIFLFLTGVTLAFMMDSSERKGLPASGRFFVGLRRAGYLMVVAFLFRIQLWAFSSPRHIEDIFRVDILNCMGLALAACSVMAVFRTTERVRLCAVLGAAIAIASPVVSEINWSGAPELLKNYLVPSNEFFGFFPWAAFLFFGASYGSLQRTVKPRRIPQLMQWLAMAGITLAFGAYALSALPLTIYATSDFWLNGPALIVIKTGVILLALSFAFLWTSQESAQSWSWVRQFGTTSLVVYWVHIELVYGRWMGALKENLTIGESVVAAVGVTLLMLMISVAKTTYPVWRQKLLPTPAISSNDYGD
jgi:peptidoglycan/LPS O-acetylase OafA/YrhL